MIGIDTNTIASSSIKQIWLVFSDEHGKDPLYYICWKIIVTFTTGEATEGGFLSNKNKWDDSERILV